MVGSGAVLYALTGMLSECVSLESFQDWARIEQLLSNPHYTNKDVVIGCYTPL